MWSTGYRRFNLRAMRPVTIWDSGDTGEVIDYHGTDLSPPSSLLFFFLLFLSLFFCFPSPYPSPASSTLSSLACSFSLFLFLSFLASLPQVLSNRRQNLYLAAATEMHPRLNGGRAFNGAANCETKNIWFPKEQP